MPEDTPNQTDFARLAFSEIVKLFLRHSNLDIGPAVLSLTGHSTTEELQQTLSGESDRGCTLMAAAFLDSALGILLRAILLNRPQILDELLQGTGPLATFSSRIEIAYVLGLIGPEVRRDLHMIRRIRNEFAHCAQGITFEHGPIASRCRELCYARTIFEADQSSRGKFVRAVMSIAGYITARCQQSTRASEGVDIDCTDENRVRQFFQILDTAVRSVNPDAGSVFSIRAEQLIEGRRQYKATKRGDE